ncbi:MAG: PIN domain-containing protein [Deltaproteobacteria bacterium]|nr:PIN domain-containing protein [Deltaproteobacteria bacterium]
MKILFDTNIVLDVLLDREPFSDLATKLFSRVEKKELKGFLGATTVTTIYYLASKVAGKKKADREISKLLSLFQIAPVNKPVLDEAIKSKFSDFEDSVLHEAAKQSGVQGIVTRNPKDFKKATLSIYSPEELYKLLVSISH